jgi:hypothetical protein
MVLDQGCRPVGSQGSDQQNKSGVMGLVGHNAEVWSKQEGGKIHSRIMDWMKEHKGDYGP